VDRQRQQCSATCARQHRFALASGDTDRALPKLSAVEQTVIDPASALSEEEILAQLVDLARKHPQIIRKLQAQIGPNGAVQTGKDDDHEVSKVA
jgi:hypothetical protein